MSELGQVQQINWLDPVPFPKTPIAGHRAYLFKIAPHDSNMTCYDQQVTTMHSSYLA